MQLQMKVDLIWLFCSKQSSGDCAAGIDHSVVKFADSLQFVLVGPGAILSEHSK